MFQTTPEKTLVKRISEFAEAVAADIKRLDGNSQPSFVVTNEEMTDQYVYYGGTVNNVKKVIRFEREPFRKQIAIGEWNDRYTLSYEDE